MSKGMQVQLDEYYHSIEYRNPMNTIAIGHTSSSLTADSNLTFNTDSLIVIEDEVYTANATLEHLKSIVDSKYHTFIEGYLYAQVGKELTLQDSAILMETASKWFKQYAIDMSIDDTINGEYYNYTELFLKADGYNKRQMD